MAIDKREFSQLGITFLSECNSKEILIKIQILLT